MIVAMQEVATEEQIQAGYRRAGRRGFEVHRSTGVQQTVLGAVGARVDFDTARHRGAARRGAGTPHQRALQAGGEGLPSGGHGDSVCRRVSLGRQGCGGDGRPLLGGVARADSLAPPKLSPRPERACLRGGAFKPRSSPYAFQGMGEDGLKLLREAGEKYGLMVISEVMEIIADRADGALRRHIPGGRAQYAELQPAARTG